MVMKVVARASNRAFLSLPLCRNEELLDLGIKFTMDVAISGKILSLFPGFLKPLVQSAASLEGMNNMRSRLVASYVVPLRKTIESATKILLPEVNRRRQLMADYGSDFPDKPVCSPPFQLPLRNTDASQNDMLMWLMDFGQGHPTRSSDTDVRSSVIVS
jgi:hypothetical protein